MTEPQLTDTFAWDTGKDVTSGVTYKEVPPSREPHPIVNTETATEYGSDYQDALKYSPEMRAYWTPRQELGGNNSFLERVWNSAKRDSFLGNTARYVDQLIQETDRNNIDAGLIWDHREELLLGISDEYHEEILNAPTFALAQRESARIRSREQAMRREYNDTFGQALVADVLGFMVDPTNLLPGYGMLKGVSVAKRMSALSAVKTVAQSTKMQQMATLAAAGGFEEAIRMAPRYLSDPTYEANNYMEGIAMSAAFSGLLPAAFGGMKSATYKGIDVLPDIGREINGKLHAWGVDVGVRQAMRFPSELKRNGFKDPGTALRKSKEAAQDSVSQKVKEINAVNQRKAFDTALKEDLKGGEASVSKTVDWMERQVDKIGDAAFLRVQGRAKRFAVATGATVAATTVGGPMAGVATATLFANKDYISVAAKLAVKQRRARRVAYDAAISAGDKEAAAKILRSAKNIPTKETAAEFIQEEINAAVDRAKQRIRQVHNDARPCA